MKWFTKWWRPHTYHVEYFKGAFGMCSWHDKKEFDNLEDTNKRLKELSEMGEEEITKELGFMPTFLRILEVISPSPHRRLLNALGSKRLYRFNLFGWRFHI